MKIIQIAVIPAYEGDDEFAPSPHIIIGLSEDGKVYRLESGGSPEERDWSLIK